MAVGRISDFRVDARLALLKETTRERARKRAFEAIALAVATSLEAPPEKGEEPDIVLAETLKETARKLEADAAALTASTDRDE
jgi:hypothetical protein